MLGILIGAAVAAQLIDTITESRMCNMPDMVYIDRNASSFHQKYYKDVIRELLGMGFTNVNAVEIRKYKQGFLTRNIYGQVQSVTINGKDSYTKGDRFAKNAHIVVSFHVFKDSPPVVIPEIGYNRNSNMQYEQNTRRDMRGYQRPSNYNKPEQAESFDISSEYIYCEYCCSLCPKNIEHCPHCGAILGR